jgi:hypothetical protein
VKAENEPGVVLHEAKVGYTGNKHGNKCVETGLLGK